MKTIITKYLVPTEDKPARYKATVKEYGRVKSATINIDYSLNDGERSDQAVLELARRMGWDGVMVRGHHKDGFVYVFEKDHHLILNEVVEND